MIEIAIVVLCLSVAITSVIELVSKGQDYPLGWRILKGLQAANSLYLLIHHGADQLKIGVSALLVITFLLSLESIQARAKNG